MQMNNEEKKISNLNDIALVRKILSGAPNHYDDLQKKYKPVITNLIRRMIKDEDDIADITQDTFIKAYKALENFKFNYSFASWLFKIASNTCIDFLRKKRFDTISIERAGVSGDEEIYIDIPDSSTLPDLSLLARERRDAIKKAIESLPEKYREIIQLRYNEELEYEEIASRLKLPLGTVKAHLFRARKLLQYSLKKDSELFKNY